MGSYDPNAVSAIEQKLKLIAEKYPDTREVVSEAISMLSNQWARIAMVRHAMK